MAEPPPPPAERTFEEIQRADLEAIRAKAAAGGILTDTELRRLRQAEERSAAPPVPGELAPVWVSSQVELAKELGDCDRKTIQRWLKIEGDAAPPGKASDGRYNVTAWKLWAHNHGKLGKRQPPIEDKQALELAGIRLRNEKQEIENAVRRGELMHVDEVCKVLTEMTSGFVQGARGLEHTLAPQVAGSMVAEAAKRIRREVEAILTRLSLGEWAKKKTFWSNVYAHLFDLHKRFNLGGGQSDTS